jgi:Protein of unknown function (DUF3592)
MPTSGLLRGIGLGLGCGLIAANLVPLIMAGIGGYFGYTSWQLTKGGQTVSGTVTHLDQADDTDGGTTYAPIVSYEVGGQSYEFNTHNYSYPPAYQVGQQVTVLYDPANPGYGRLNNFWDLWALPIALCPSALLVFLLFNGLPAYILVSRRRRQRL